MPPSSTPSRRAETIAVIVIAAVVAVLAAVRCSMGVSFFDDSHYVTVSLRLAQGARPFADEMSMQSLGFLPAAAFTWLWTHLFGLTGLVMAFRLFYVVLAGAVATLAYRQLARSFRPAVAALAVTVPLLCPPFNLLAPGYNLMTSLGLLAATALAHRALMERHVPAAAGAGVALVFASIVYPPMAVVCAVFVIVFAVLARDRRLVITMLAAAVIAAFVFVSALFSVVSFADFGRALAYSSANVIRFASPLDKLGVTLNAAAITLDLPALWPLWACAVLASLPKLPNKVRGVLLFALAPLADLRGFQAVHGGARVFGITASAWLITFVLGAVVPVSIWAFSSGRRGVRALLTLAIPVSIAGFTTVAFATDAGWIRVVEIIGIVPLSVAVLVGWASALEELWDDKLLALGALTALVIALGMLYATSIDDSRPRLMTAVMDHGAYVGMRMSPDRYRELVDMEAAGRRWVRPGDRVTFYGERQGYLLTGGQIYTNAVWLYLSPSDRFALDYFQQHGGLPDVIFADEHGMRMRQQDDYRLTAPSNPLVAVLLANYHIVGHVDDFAVWVRR